MYKVAKYWLEVACFGLVLFIVVFTIYCLMPPRSYEARHGGHLHD